MIIYLLHSLCFSGWTPVVTELTIVRLHTGAP